MEVFCHYFFNHLNHFLSVHFNIVKHIHTLVELIFRCFSSYKTATLYPLFNNSPIFSPSKPWEPPLFQWIHLFLVPHISRIIQYSSFYNWLISLYIMSSRYIPSDRFCKFFFHSVPCLFNLMKWSLAKERFLILMKLNYQFSSFMDCTFGIMSKNSSLKYRFFCIFL